MPTLQQQQQQQQPKPVPDQSPLQLQTQQFTQSFSQQQQTTTPVDITDKKVYLATPDGKMTAYKVILHTGSSNDASQPQRTAGHDPPTPSTQIQYVVVFIHFIVGYIDIFNNVVV